MVKFDPSRITYGRTPGMYAPTSLPQPDFGLSGPFTTQEAPQNSPDLLLSQLREKAMRDEEAYANSVRAMYSQPQEETPQRGRIGTLEGVLAALGSTIAGSMTGKDNSQQFAFALKQKQEGLDQELQEKILKAREKHAAQMERAKGEAMIAEFKARRSRQEYEDEARRDQAIKLSQMTTDRQIELARMRSRQASEALALKEAGKPWPLIKQMMDGKYGEGMWDEEQILKHPAMIMAMTGRNVEAPGKTEADTVASVNNEKRKAELHPILKRAAELKNIGQELTNAIKWENYQHYDDNLALKMAMFDLQIKKFEHEINQDSVKAWWEANGREMEGDLAEAEKAIPKAKADWDEIDAKYKRKVAEVKAKEKVLKGKTLTTEQQLDLETTKAERDGLKEESDAAFRKWSQANSDAAQRRRTLNQMKSRAPKVEAPSVKGVKQGGHGKRLPSLDGSVPKGKGSMTVKGKKGAPEPTAKLHSMSQVAEMLGL